MSAPPISLVERRNRERQEWQNDACESLTELIGGVKNGKVRGLFIVMACDDAITGYRSHISPECSDHEMVGYVEMEALAWKLALIAESEEAKFPTGETTHDD